MDQKKQSKGGLIFDVAFELVLIIAVLFTAMMLSQGDVIGGPYTINWVKTLVPLGLIAVYLVFICWKSTKSMDEDIAAIYEESKQGEEL